MTIGVRAGPGASATGHLRRSQSFAQRVRPVLLLALRSLLAIARRPALLLPYVGFPVLVAALNAAALGKVTQLAGFPAVNSYLDFILPGTILVVVLVTATDVGSDVATDIETGFFDRLLSSPMPRSLVFLGRLAGIACFGGIQALVFIVTLALFGASVEGGAPAIVTILLVSMILAAGIGALMSALALRTGSGDAVEAMFPLFMVAQFASSAFFPRDLMHGWIHTVATLNPLSWMIEDLRHLVIKGFDLSKAAQAMGLGAVLLAVSVTLATVATRHAVSTRGEVWRGPVQRLRTLIGPARAKRAGPGTGTPLVPVTIGYASARGREGSFPAVSLEIASRYLTLLPRVPSTFVPMLLIPIIYMAAYSQALGAVARFPGYPAQSVLDWILPTAVLQGAILSGLATGMSAIRDIRTGFIDRLLCAPAPPLTLVVGPTIACVVRSALPFVTLLAVGALLGADLPGGIAGLGMLWLATAAVAVIAAGWALGLALRLRNAGAFVPIMQLSTFAALAISTAQVPLVVMTPGLRSVAQVNPMTNVLTLARQGFVGHVTWAHTWPGLLVLAVAMSFTMLFAVRGLRRVLP